MSPRRLALLLAALAALAPAATAHATTPGANGRVLGVQPVDDEEVPDTDTWLLVDPLTGDSTYFGFAPFTTQGTTTAPAWAPDGRSIAFVDWTEPQHGDFDDGPRPNDVIVQPVDGTQASGARRNLTRSTADERDVAWSPPIAGVARIAFTRRVVDPPTRRPYRGELWVTEGDGSSQRQITAGPTDAQADWSPDGTRIAFSRGPDGKRDLYVVAAEGGPVKRLTTAAGDDEDPSWSPDGTQVVYVRGAYPSRRLWVLDVATGATRALTPVSADAREPAWSPDGSVIAFVTPVSSYPKFAFIRPDGSGLRISQYGRSPNWERVNRLPTASLRVSRAGATGDTVTLTSTAADPDGPLWRLRWDLDDDGEFDDAQGATADVALPAGATGLTVRLQATDQDGATATTAQTVSIANQPPVASFTVAPDAPRTGELVTFRSTAGDPDGVPLARQEWDLDGDGAYDDGAGPVATFRYPTAGVHAVALRVADAAGALAAVRGSVTVSEAQAGGGGVPDPAGPLAVRVAAGRGLRALAGSGLRVRVACPRACRASVRLTVSRRTAQRLGTSRTLAIAARGLAQGHGTVRLRPAPAARRRLARLVALRATLRVAALDADGARWRATRLLLLRREGR